MGRKSKKMGICVYQKKFFGWFTVSDKGQVVIPKIVRKILNINKGDKLLIIVREDKKGLNLLKAELLEDFFEKLSKEGGE